MPEFSLIAVTVALVYVASLVCIYRILMTYRTAQGALAWVFALLALPWITLPLFLLIGRSRFGGYIKARRMGDAALTNLLNRFEQQVTSLRSPAHEHFNDELQVLSKLARQPFTEGNHSTLLRDGEATFDALFDSMENAQHYILLEFYIVRSDRVGQRIKSILERKLAEGVEVWFLHDNIGSFGLPRKYIRELTQAGANTAAFDDGNVRRWRFQMNFRNHRKILVCDGKVGFVGGINLGDEYLGKAMDQEPWRDTHCRIEGPAVTGLQLAWLEDWNWASDTVPALNWAPHHNTPGDEKILILPTGPADRWESCTLFFLNCINNARERVWIASPYFVPDVQIMNALQLAALRGIDVRILIPEKPDSRIIGLAAYSYLVQACQAGIQIYRYQPGFMHQKVILVDSRYTAVGTANLDNRSMRLNFEITAINTSGKFVEEVDTMLTEDFKQSHLMDERDYRDRSLAFRITCRAIRLAAPLL